MIYKITYVSYTFTNDKGKTIEKIKDVNVEGETELDARYHFLSKKIKHKSIKKIEKDNSNTIGNMFPGLSDLKSKLN